MTYDFKGHVKIVEIYMAKFNVSISNGLKIMGFFVNAKYIHKNNVISNKTVTKLFTILTKCFFHIWTLQATLKHNAAITLPSRHEMFLRDLNQISIERDISQTSQKYLKKDVFFVTSLRYLKKDVFCVVSLRRLEHISKKMSFPWPLRDVSKTSLPSIFGFSKIRHKNDFVWFP